MANGFDPRLNLAADPSVAAGARGVAVDAGLRSYMLSVYNYMTSGVLLTGIVALLMVQSGAVYSLFDPATGRASPLAWIVMLAPLGLVFWLSFGINRMSSTTAKAVFWLYAALLGASLSTVLLVYTASSVASTFFATAAGFASLSLWGYTTKRDLSGMGSFLLIGLVGLLVAMVINMFIPSGPMGFAISVIGVLLFAGLTAYDTQTIKSIYFTVRGDSELAAKSAVMGALKLYLDFINMFMFLLRLFGDRR
ncbi:MAG: Bax inhibitor/YccA family protein [Alphaproteobacteria bacterium]|nr:Bax inhibitor/YccA family protein [Alphaproteobacteria bacterium]